MSGPAKVAKPLEIVDYTVGESRGKSGESGLAKALCFLAFSSSVAGKVTYLAKTAQNRLSGAGRNGNNGLSGSELLKPH